MLILSRQFVVQFAIQHMQKGGKCFLMHFKDRGTIFPKLNFQHTEVYYNILYQVRPPPLYLCCSASHLLSHSEVQLFTGCIDCFVDVCSAVLSVVVEA